MPDRRAGTEAGPRATLERAILGDAPVFTALEVAAETGVTIEEAAPALAGARLPRARPVETAFTRADAERGLAARCGWSTAA